MQPHLLLVGEVAVADEGVDAPDAVRGDDLRGADGHVGDVPGPEEEARLRDQRVLRALLNQGEETLRVVRLPYTGPKNNACTWFGEICTCSCLPLLPQLACNILATIYVWAQYKVRLR